MIFAKIDVGFPRHYRILEVRPESVRIPLGLAARVAAESVAIEPRESDGPRADVSSRIARAAALGVWTAALCYSREHMLDGFCPLVAIRWIAADEVVEELVAQGLLAHAEREGRPGVAIVNYAKHNESRAEIERRLQADRRRKGSVGVARERAGRVRSDSDRSAPGTIERIPCSESEPEPDTEKRSPSRAPAERPAPSGDHAQLVAHFVAEFERLKGVQPEIGARGGAGAKKLLQGRTLGEAKAIVDRALSDPWWLDRNPDLAAIAGKINSFIGRRGPPAGGPPGQAPLQPPGGSWRKAEVPR
jgi:hypothetical protein